MRYLQIVHETFANVCKQSQNVETTSILVLKNVENTITQIAQFPKQSQNTESAHFWRDM